MSLATGETDVDCLGRYAMLKVIVDAGGKGCKTEVGRQGDLFVEGIIEVNGRGWERNRKMRKTIGSSYVMK